MTIDRPISYHLGPALLVSSALLAGLNWYLQPEQAAAWAAALFVVGCMTAAFYLAFRISKNEGVRRETVASITSAIVFAGLIMSVSLSAKLALTLGTADDGDLSRRATMAILGAMFMFTGNAFPKRLTPLSALQCDGARLQAFQRFAGWTWVLTGFAFAIVWLVLPLDLAKPVSVALLMSGMLIIGAQIVRLRRTRQRVA